MAVTPAGPRQWAAAGGESLPVLAVTVPLAAHEDAAILLVQDGYYSWHFESTAGTTPPPNRRQVPTTAH